MLERQLFGIVSRYYFALLYDDMDTVKELLSKRRLDLFAKESSDKKETLESVLAVFVDKQKSKILRIPYQSHDKHCISPLCYAVDGGTVSLQLSLGQSDVSKPIYFVFEDDQYKLNVLNPSGSDRYRVENAHRTGTHKVECRGGNKQTLHPTASVYMTCEDDCGYVWSGTWFQDLDTGRRVQCDYNTWGWDARFNESGTLECADNC